MTLSQAMRVSASGLTVERFRMNVTSTNIANANTIKIGDKDPYRRRDVTLAGGPDGVRVVSIERDMNPLPKAYAPGHAHADAEGNITKSNVEPITEMVNMMSASRSYEANIAAFNTAKGMIKNALNIGKV